MPTMSIEVLCVGSSDAELQNTPELGIDVSFPPKSDRLPSLWQLKIDAIGGTLIHLFDPQFKGKHSRWAYDIINEKDWKEFRFDSELWPIVRAILESLLKQSPTHTIIFFSDAQWSNEPVESEVTLEKFGELQSQGGIRMNTAYTIVSDGNMIPVRP